MTLTEAIQAADQAIEDSVGGNVVECEGDAFVAILEAARKTARYEPVEDQDATSLIGEGVHSGLRKGTNAPGSAAAWNAIAADDSGWHEALEFAVWGMHEMGFVICKVVNEP